MDVHEGTGVMGIPWTRVAVLLFGLFFSQASASVCPVMMVSATGDPDAMVVTVRNAGKLPIRRLEFNCTPVHAQPGKAASRLCREENALLYPGTEHTARYPYPRGKAQAMLLSLKSVTLSDGTVWKPSKRQPCRMLRISPRRGK